MGDRMALGSELRRAHGIVHIDTQCLVPNPRKKKNCCTEMLSTRTLASCTMQLGAVLSPSPIIIGNADGKVQVLTRRPS